MFIIGRILTRVRVECLSTFIVSMVKWQIISKDWWEIVLSTLMVVHYQRGLKKPARNLGGLHGPGPLEECL